MKSLLEVMANEGLFHTNNWKQETKGDYVADILCFDEPSQYGIKKGRISKLCIRNKRNRGDWLCNYDRGWDVRPAKEVKDFYDEIIKKYN